jgi:tRNA A37 threonylcarbamoyladenosine synthetase subunit TsaC/SUA5/YrdC
LVVFVVLWLKRRSPAKGLILLASDVNFLYPYVEDASLLWQLLNVSNGTQTMSIDDYANFKLDTNK